MLNFLRIGLLSLPVLAAGEPAAGGAAGGPPVTVEFLVQVPEGTPPGAELFLAGNAAALGGWSPRGLALERRAGGRFQVRVQLLAGTRLEFKVTRGSWALVEKAADGKEIANRTLTAEKDERVEVQVAAWAAGAPPLRRSTLSGDVRRHDRFASRHLGNERSVLVYLPPGYEEENEARYPVLYLSDGQNLFDEATSFSGEWQVDEVCERLIRARRLRPILVVGVANNARRIEEYTPWPDPGLKAGGRGDLYGRFLVEELKPFIDRTYRTSPGREATGIGGSSLGGLIALHLARSHRQSFGLCAAISPALWWNGRKLVSDYADEPGAIRETRFWLDMGTAEGRAAPGKAAAAPIDDTRELARVLERAGLRPGRDFVYQEVPEGQHNEAAWSARLDQVLCFLYGPPPPATAAHGAGEELPRGLPGPRPGAVSAPGVSGTFSIVAVDPEAGVAGAAVASKYPSVGKVVPYVRADAGAFCTQHWHEPRFGERALDLLAAGKRPEEVLAELLRDDPNAEKRQLAIIDMKGRAANRNPSQADASGIYWGAMSGRYYACQGNTLAGREVIVAMARAYEDTRGSLADRLVAALEAGDCAGGDHRGRLAAGIRVARRGVAGTWLEIQIEKSDDAVRDLAKRYAELDHPAKGEWRGARLPFEDPCPPEGPAKEK